MSVDTNGLRAVADEFFEVVGPARPLLLAAADEIDELRARVFELDELLAAVKSGHLQVR